MFTGIITAIGHILDIQTNPNGSDNEATIRIATPWDTSKIEYGSSIACAGVCLTVTQTGQDNGTHWFEIYASPETCQCTTIGHRKKGDLVNLEPALRIGDELGGHMVTGHVDDQTRVTERKPVGNSTLFRFAIPPDLKPFIVSKGAITLDGISLTVNDVSDTDFSVNIIPYTLEHTTWNMLQCDDRVNLEIDMMARYAAGLAQTQKK